MSYYVYSRLISSGREDFCGVYDTMKEAVHRVAALYQNDKQYNEDEYYYFIKAH